MEKLLKRNPSLLTAQQPATNLIGPIANIGSRKKKIHLKKKTHHNLRTLHKAVLDRQI